MKAIILEDESLSAEHLRNLLKAIDDTITVTAVYGTIQRAALAFSTGIDADLLFADIQLADGLCFDLFDKVPVEIPVIFTTAYDNFAIRAFRLNSVDYLLKPVGKAELEQAIEKYRKLSSRDYSKVLDNIMQTYKSISRQYKTRFMIRMGDNIFPVPASEVACFVHEDSIVLLVTHRNHRYPVDFTLDQLESILDPGHFFRINRKAIIGIDSIIKVGSYFNSRLKIQSNHLHDDQGIVSRERVGSFKEWLGK